MSVHRFSNKTPFMRRSYYLFLSLIALSFVWSCKKEYSYESGDPDKIIGLGWSLRAADTLKQGCIDTAYYSTFANGKSLTIEGTNGIGNAIYIGLISPSGALATGNYSSSTSTASMEYTSRGVDIYSLSTTADYLSVDVTAITDTTIEADFSASLTNNVSGKSIVITSGKIKAYIGKRNACGVPPQEGTSSALPPVAVDGDYFPLTQNSWWSYTASGLPDSVVTTSNLNFLIAGNTYRRFTTTYAPQSYVDSSNFYRRGSNGDYLQFTYPDRFTTDTFDVAPTPVDITFLKKTVSLGSSWASAEYSGLVKNVPTKFKYVFTVTGVNGKMTANGVTYSNVIKVSWKSQVSKNGGAYTDDKVFENDYAKDIGLIYFDYLNFGLSLKNYKVY